MAAGRAARNGNSIRVNSQLLGICPHPANRALHILNGGRKRRLARETITCGRNHETVLSELGAVVVIDLSVTAGPTATVKEQDCREGMRPFLRGIKVELKCFVAALSILDILLDGHCIGNID